MGNEKKGKYMNRKVNKWLFGAVGSVKFIYFASVVCGALGAVFAVFFAVSVKDVINSAFSASPVLNNIIKNAIISASLLILSYALMTANRLLIEKCRVQAEVNLKNYAIKSLLKKDFSAISTYSTGDVVSRVMGDSEIVASAFAQVLPVTVSVITRSVLAVGVLVAFQPIFTCALLVVGAVFVGLSFLLKKVVKRLHKTQRQKNAVVQSIVTESASSLLAIKVFSAESKIEKNASGALGDYAVATKKQRYFSSATQSAVSFAFSFLYIATILYGAFGIYYGNVGIDFGMITSMVQLVAQLQAPLANVSSIFSMHFEMIASCERLMEVDFLTDEPNLQKVDSVDLYEKITALKAENLTFNYGREVVLSGLNFSINKGDMVLLKGESGAGKSTLFSLMLGVYGATSGKIGFETPNGFLPIDASFRSMFGYVPQGNALFSGTILQNVCFLNEGATQAEIDKVLQICQLDFINDLPQKMQTVVGESGFGLSQGQAQRIAIARAILSNKPILLLDEATSALDQQTEANVIENISNYLENKTCIFISHRPSLDKVCSQVIKIDKIR